MLSRRALLKKILHLSGGTLAACTTAPGSTPPTPTAAPQSNTTATSNQPAATQAQTEAFQVLLTGLDFPEGPAFDPQGRLWCTELNGGNIVRFEDGKPVRHPIGGGRGGRGNGMLFDRQGRAWVTDSGRNVIQRFDPAAEKWEVMLDSIDGAPLQSPNDLCFDAQGNLIFTCPNFANTDPTGYVVCLKPDGTAQKIVEGFYRPNGLDIVDGGSALVVADTFRKTLFKGAWDAVSQTWQDPQPWAEVGGSEGPDGMAPGADGLLYQAIYGDGVIRVVGSDGKVQREIKVPGDNPTNAAVDPSGKLGLVVTETEIGQLVSLPNEKPGAAIFDGGDAWK